MFCGNLFPFGSFQNHAAVCQVFPQTSVLPLLQGTSVFDSFRVFDPRLPPGRAGLDRAKGPFREALTFMIGGGNYLEREALVAWASRATPQRQVREYMGTTLPGLLLSVPYSS
jgi:hypothetical protein